MNRKQLYFATSILLIYAFLYSCKPSNLYSGSLKGEVLNADFKKYFAYNVGSNWIFYDSLNNEQDSLFVFTYQTTPAQDGENRSNERASIVMRRNVPQTGLEDYEVQLALLASSRSLLNVVNGGNEVSYFFLTGMPFAEGEKIDSIAKITSNVRSIPSYVCGGVTYSDVYEVIYNYDNQHLADTFCINADNGFIAILLNDPYFHKRLFLQRGKIVH